MRFTELSQICEARAHLRKKYPRINTDGLSWPEIKDLANDVTVPVKKAGKRKYILMKAEDVIPGGLLDQRNAEVKRKNAEIRRQKREARAKLLSENPLLADLEAVMQKWRRLK